MQFFVGSIGRPGEDYVEENFDRIFENKGFVLHNNTKQKGSFHDIKSGDVILLKYNRMLIAYGKVTEVEITDDEEWNHWAYVEKWFQYNAENPRDGVSRYGIDDSTLTGGKYGTVKAVNLKFAMDKLSEINSESELYQQLLNTDHSERYMLEIENLLRYKKQIILQGPPGTGKTKLAKELAEKLTLGNKVISPTEEIEKFFNDFEVTEEVKEHRRKVDNLNNIFLQKFKKEDIKNLSLENYALGSDNLDNFCYWLEYKLADTGKYTGRATKGKIYWDADAEEYRKTGFVKDIEDDNDAMKSLALLLDKIISEKFENYPIGKGFVLKVLNTYYPEKYFPINSEKCLDNFLKLVKEDYSTLNYIEKNKRVQDIFTEINKRHENKVMNYEFMYFLFHHFDLKGEIVLEDDNLISKGETKLIQFHPSFTYEDFVRGIVAKPNKQGTGILYDSENKVLGDFANKAISNPTAVYVLIIDEINRANLASVLGELIYALEYRGEAVESMYAIEDESGNKLILPPNLYIIGTMNTADRSVGHIDYAIRRRFAFVDVPAENLKKTQGLQTFDDLLFDTVAALFDTNLSPEFEKKDVQLGHSYFIDKLSEKDGATMAIRLEYEIKPILREYIRDGVLIGEKIKEKIEALAPSI